MRPFCHHLGRSDAVIHNLIVFGDLCVASHRASTKNGRKQFQLLRVAGNLPISCRCGRALGGRLAGTGSTTGSEPAGRLKKPSWKDPRFIVGLLLVLASIAAVVAVVENADQTTKVYAAKDNIAVGQHVKPRDLVAVPVRLGEVRDEYITVADGLPGRAYAQRLVNEGELLAASALDRADPLDRKPVGITVTEALPNQAKVGSRVDVWVSRPLEDGSYEEPELLLPQAEISEISKSSSALGSATATQLHVLVQDDQMPDLLAALSNEAKLAVVWNPGGES